ncbi:MAG: GH92 family glycosyl hydrolase [Pyrinomonadaceae bacterium]|nr:GH92 family glycosyl hydrolase [Acidobacteriota bacterium]MBP7377332.1 GH92 family glycosyl hydrolase [Pyrinomonadaceae bacterium]
MKIVAKHQRLASLFILCLFVLFVGKTNAQDYTRWVNPFIGTGGHGHTFPGATMPFGMVQLSPDTRIDNWDGSSGYHYSDDTIYGFSHTHLSGTGIPDYCDILFMPTVDEGRTWSPKDLMIQQSGRYSSKFSHSDEKAEPGYYSVKINDAKLLVELTATARVGFHRYTFPESEDAGINLDMLWRDKTLESKVKVVSDRRIEGFRRSSSWAKNQTVYFVAEFSKPIIKSSDGRRAEGSSVPETGNENFFFPLSTSAGEQILLKVAISNVSIEGARKNLAAELPGWNFDKVRANAKAAWNKELSKIEVSGGTDAQTTTFYTALYHTMIQPNVFNDVDGSYIGHDKKIHNIRDDARSPGFSRPAAGKKPPEGGTPSDQYTVFSLWDTFRAAHPLYTIIDQRRTVDFINTFIRQYEQGGRLPVWELWGEETDTMIGYHAVSVIADAMAKGIKGFDYEKAYAAAKHSAELDHLGLKDYKRRGYISMEDEHESVSKTLEYAYNDWCIANMAKIMKANLEAKINRRPGQFETGWDDKERYGYEKVYARFSERSRYFENLFDPSTGFMRPKKNGGWVSPFAPNEVTFNFTEGNSWVYSFFVPHDVSRLMELQGGREKFAAKLDELFTTKDKLAGREQPDITGLIGQYAHGNEPSHHIAYLYNYAYQPSKTQNLVRRIMDEFYKPEPDGLIGNEDCGQMSAWYILSASGFYPVAPGDGVYAFGTPLFPEMTYRLENGKTFTVRAKNVSPSNKYILNAKLNGVPYKKAFIKHEDIMNGGVLEFAMIDQPVTTAFNEFPMSGSNTKTVAVPVIDGGARVFSGKTTVTLSTITPNAKVFYTTNGAEPKANESTLYSGPIEISDTTTIKAVAATDKDRSIASEAKFIAKPNDWTVKIEHKYNRQYTGGGDEGLIDGIRGTINFASGEWQGYQPKDLIATIDLQRETEIKRVGGGFLQNARSWIWMPTRIEFEVSTDGVNFTRVADIKTDIDPTDMKEQIRDYVQSITPLKARYVRVHAYNLGKIPSWHPGAGDDAFIFVDEILIN